MIKDILQKYGVKQLGYYVEDLEESAAFFSRAFDAGPFVDLGISEPKRLTFRGEPSGMRSRCALGQIGDMQIELIEVQTDEPDVYKESGRHGLHHVCIWADEVSAVVDELAREGCEVAMEMESGQGLQVVYLDTRAQLGHYLEVNAPLEQLANAVKAIHASWDGDETIVGMDTVMAAMGASR